MCSFTNQNFRNPFSVSRVRPGMLPYFPYNLQISRCVELWKRSGLRGQIVGPHGSGKSTLAASMTSFASAELSTVRKIILRPHPQNRWHLDIDASIENLGSSSSEQSTLVRHKLWMIDGLESVSYLHRQAFLSTVKRRGEALLATTHRPVRGLPILATIEPEVSTLTSIVQLLLKDTNLSSTEKDLFENAWSQEAYHAADGNIREALMLLYDRFEWLRREHESQTSWAKRRMEMETENIHFTHTHIA